MNITVPSGAKGSSRWLEPRSLEREREKGTGGLQTAASQITKSLVHCARSPGSQRAIENYLSRSQAVM